MSGSRTRLVRYLVVAAMLLLGLVLPATARTALVIGNSAYATAPLANPKNGASDVAAALREAGFEVELKLDAGAAPCRCSMRSIPTTACTGCGMPAAATRR